MKTIIAGTRTITDAAIVARAIQESGFMISEVVHGAARGVDTLADQWARTHGVRTTVFPAMWRVLGNGAGPIRNRKMAEYADALIAVWDGKSRGTANMIGQMYAAGKPVHVERTDRRSDGK